MPLPQEIVSKYELMREKSFERAGLKSSPSAIWKLQREANARQKEKQEDLKVAELQDTVQECESYLLGLTKFIDSTFDLPVSTVDVKGPESLFDVINYKKQEIEQCYSCLLYTSDAADE